MPTC